MLMCFVGPSYSDLASPCADKCDVKPEGVVFLSFESAKQLDKVVSYTQDFSTQGAYQLEIISVHSERVSGFNGLTISMSAFGS